MIADLAELPEQEVGGYLQTLPPQSTRSVADDGEYDELIDDLEGLLSNESQTRFPLPVHPYVMKNMKMRVRWPCR